MHALCTLPASNNLRNMCKFVVPVTLAASSSPLAGGDPPLKNEVTACAYTFGEAAPGGPGRSPTVGQPDVTADGRALRALRTRAALLEAAREVVEDQGIDALTMTALAGRANVSRRTAYLHFNSRLDVLLALFEHLGRAEGLGESLADVWAAPAADEALRRWARHVATAHVRIMRVSRAVERVRAKDPEAEEVWQQAMLQWRAGAKRLVEWLARDGRLRAAWSVSRATDLVWALMSFELVERFIVDCAWSETDYADALELWLRSALVDDAKE